MNSLSFRERFKDKISMVLKNGTFDINESSAIVKKEVPINKFHPFKKSQSMNMLNKTKEDPNSRKSTEASTYYNQPYSFNPTKIHSTSREKLGISSMNKISLGNKLNPSFSQKFIERSESITNLPFLQPKYHANSHIVKNLRNRYSSSTLCKSINK